MYLHFDCMRPQTILCMEHLQGSWKRHAKEEKAWMPHTSPWSCFEVVLVLLWWTGPAAEEAHDSLCQDESLPPSQTVYQLEQSSLQTLWEAPDHNEKSTWLVSCTPGRSGLWIVSYKSFFFFICANLVSCHFTSQAVQVVKDKLFV